MGASGCCNCSAASASQTAATCGRCEHLASALGDAAMLLLEAMNGFVSLGRSHVAIDPAHIRACEGFQHLVNGTEKDEGAGNAHSICNNHHSTHNTVHNASQDCIVLEATHRRQPLERRPDAASEAAQQRLQLRLRPEVLTLQPLGEHADRLVRQAPVRAQLAVGPLTRS